MANDAQAKRGGVDPDFVIGRVAESLGGVLEKTISVISSSFSSIFFSAYIYVYIL